MVTEDRENVNNAVAVDTAGNNAAMREALELCVQDMCRYCRAEARERGLPQCLDGCETLRIAKAALAADAVVARKGELSKTRPKNAADFGQFGNTAAMREALEEIIQISYDIERGFPDVRAVAKAALAAPARNCDIHTNFNDAITTLANKRNWHDGKWDSERYCILASWLLAPAAERKGEGDGR